MPEHGRAVLPRPRGRRATAGLLLAAALVVWPAAIRPVAAAEPDWSEPVPIRTRDGGWKDRTSSQPAAPLPTGRLIVQYRDGTPEAARGAARAAAAVAKVRDIALPNAELVEPAGIGAAQALTRLKGQGAIVSAEPEYRRTTQGGPTSETLFGEQWSLHNTGQEIETFVGVPDVDMNVPAAWDITTGSSDLVVAVLDDGVDFSHPDLAGRQWVNADEVAGNGIDDDANGFIDDVNGWDFCNGDNSVHEGTETHGTHVAGSIAGNGNGSGIAGVAPTVKIMAVKFMNDALTCGTDGMAIDAVAYAAANGATIINASWGGTGVSDALGTAIGAVPDVLMVAAAGNGGDDDIGDDNDATPIYPASYELPNILSVASVHNQGYLSEFSNFGFTSVDLSAPGEDVLSSVVGGGWQYFDGTSMAAANASGVAALAASAKPELVGDAPALRQHLIATAKALPQTLGWVAQPRLVDARAAVVSTPDIRRLSGANRFATAAEISKATFTPFVPYVFIATGATFPDALAGGAVAAQTGSPLLLVQQNGIPSATMAELQRLEPYAIFVLGGSAVISEPVFQQLRGLAFDDAYRLAGDNRYGTAAAVAAEFVWTAGVPNVFVANGQNFPDALSSVPAAGALGGPLLLTSSGFLPNETKLALQSLDPARVVILGGDAMVSPSVATQIATAAEAPTIRWFGDNRYATAQAIANSTFGPLAETAFVASGLNFPDALAGGPSGGAYGGPMLLTRPGSLPPETAAALSARDPARIFILGGTTQVSNTVVNQIDLLFP